MTLLCALSSDRQTSAAVMAAPAPAHLPTRLSVPATRLGSEAGPPGSPRSPLPSWPDSCPLDGTPVKTDEKLFVVSELLSCVIKHTAYVLPL